MKPSTDPPFDGPHQEFFTDGIKSTIPLHREMFNHAAFIEGQVDTTFIEKHWRGKGGGPPSRAKRF